MDRLDAASIDVPGVQVRVVEKCESTNSLLLESDVTPALLAAEAQTAGRGQRGRHWHSTPGTDITFSLACELARPARELAGLPLVAGVAAATALRALGVTHVSLKWPNDLLVQGAKLGGILVESRAQGRGTRVVIGIGINCARPPGLERRLRRRIAALEDAIHVSRNRVIASLARSLIAALERFESEGLESVRREWQAMDAYAGRRLRVRLADGRSVSGIGGGLAEDGALLLRTRSGEQAIRSGRIVSAGLS